MKAQEIDDMLLQQGLGSEILHSNSEQMNVQRSESMEQEQKQNYCFYSDNGLSDSVLCIQQLQQCVDGFTKLQSVKSSIGIISVGFVSFV